MTLLELLAAYGALIVLLLAMWMILRASRERASAPEPPVEVETIRLATPADMRAFLQDPDIPPVVKGIVAQAAHDAGLCGCDVFDRDGQLTETDVEWLHSQQGGPSS